MTPPPFLPVAEKSIWCYSDCFPPERPFRLTSTFCHRNYRIDMHRHDFYEVNFIVRGKGEHYTERNHYEIGVGDIIVVPPACPHGYFEIENLDVFHMLIHKDFFHRYYGELHMLAAFTLLFNADYLVRKASRELPVFHVQGEGYDELLRLFTRLADLEQSDTAESYLSAYAQSIMLIVCLCTEYKRQFLKTEERKPREGSDLAIFAAVDYIHDHYAEKITLDELCRLTYLSKTALCEKFRKLMGFTPLNYVNYYRVLAAKRILLETTESIAEIAQDVGFFDTSHFVRTYKKYEGVSPSALRNAIAAERRGE